ncbi:hypothetical protein [Yinghuangia soli]|uniref:Lipoprotein n=1 Tax=Yinghuangia soli TaxID=2908204 RepID=A0AA41Q317_9ACTN|nr:hypothetical protein [Yinghuangia soli]MCF2530629.1 hypothetical protein [Yinghuangia soli]
MRFIGKRLAIAAAIPMFLLVSACESGGKKDDTSDTVATRPGNSQTPGAGTPGGKALTARQLQDALLTGDDLPGYRALSDSVVDEDIYSDKTVDKAECLPLAQLLSPARGYRPLAAAQVAVTKEGAPLGHTAMVSTATYAAGTAEKLVAEARAALAKCTSFAMTDDEGDTIAFAVRPGPAQPGAKDGKGYGFGDDSLVVEFVADLSGSAIVCLVRSGSALVQVYGSAVGDKPSESTAAAATAPEAMVRAQYDKLVKAQQN